MKKFLPVIIVGAVLVIGVVWWRGREKSLVKEPAARPKIQEPVNTVPLEERVYTTLEIGSGEKFPTGREITLSIFGGKEAASIEYELEYQAGTLVQAGLGAITPVKEKLPYERDILLGSCSAGGACNYHEDVKGGTLTLRFKGTEIGSLRGEWNYYQPRNDGLFSSRDAKFQLKDLKLAGTYVLIAQTIGLPKPVTGRILAGPYHFDTTASVGGGELTIRLSDESETATLWRWDGKIYTKVKSDIAGKTLTAAISSVGTYLVTD